MWVVDSCSLMFKCWRVGFDPRKDYFQCRHLWVLLPELPLQLRNQKALEAIMNDLHKFIKVDDSLLKAPDRRICKVLFEIDIHVGLLESLRSNGGVTWWLRGSITLVFLSGASTVEVRDTCRETVVVGWRKRFWKIPYCEERFVNRHRRYILLRQENIITHRRF